MRAVGGVEVEEGDLARLVAVDGQVVGGQGQGHDGAVHGQGPHLVARHEVPDTERHVEATRHHRVAQYGQPPHPARVTTTSLLSARVETLKL